MNGNPPTSTTDDNTTTPKETKEAIKVIDDEVKKGNITKDEGKKQVSHQVSSMKGSKPPEVKKGRPRGLAVRLLGLGQRALIGDWSWELMQLQVVSTGDLHDVVDAGLAGDETQREYHDGHILASFIQDPNTAETYNFHLKGKLLGTLQDTEPDTSGLPLDKVIHFQIPNALFDKANVATATVTAMWDKYDVKDKTGSVATTEWKVAAHGDAETIPGLKLLAKIVGSVSGEVGWSEAISNEHEQTWSFYYYNGAFDENVKVD
jgi:hypothetical protein